jgi:hypothetical protein
VRIALTLIAVALVAALSAALVAPLFVDWSAQRGFIELQLSRQLGARVAIAGPIEARFLPTPYLTIEDVTVGGAAAPQGATTLSAKKMRLELALGALTGGRIRFTEIDFDRPVARVAADADGTIHGIRSAVGGLADRVAFDRLIVKNGQINFDRAGSGAFALAGVDFDGSAKSLSGPFRGSGEASTPQGERLQFEFATSEFAGATLPIKAEVDWPKGGLRAAFDGGLALMGTASVESSLRPIYSGAAVFSGSFAAEQGREPLPWKVSGALAADLNRAKLDALSASFGPDARALEASGEASADFAGSPVFSADLQSKQLNFDALLRREGEEAAPPARLLRALEFLGDVLARPSILPIQFNLAFSTPTVFLGAQSLDQLNLSASAKPSEPVTGVFETGLPGQGRLRLSGAFESGAGAGFRGQAEARIGDFRTLRDWAAEDAPELSARLAGLGNAFPYAGASATADLEASGVGFSARNLKLAIDRSTFTGAVAFTQPHDTARGRLFIDLHSDALDMDAAPNLADGGDWLAGIDLSLALEASKLRIARIGQTALDSGSLVLRATKTGAAFSLDRLSLADLGGANIEAQGETTPTRKWAKLRLDAAHLRDFAELVARVAPSRYSRMLVERAEALSPARASFEARREGDTLAGAFPLDFLKAEGEAGKSRFSVKLSNAPAPVDAIAADIAVDAADGAVLLRQLGANVPSTPAGKAHIALKASGKWESGFDVQSTASLAGADATWRGRYLPGASASEDPSLFGAATLKADNLLPALAAFGLTASNAGAVAPADLTADFAVRGAGASLPRIAGTLSGAKITGNLAWRQPNASTDAVSLDPDVQLAQAIAGEAPTATAAQISGEVSLDRATAGALFALPLGPAPAAKSGARWSDAKFGPPLLRAPPTDIALKIGALDFGEGAPARNFAARFRMGADKLDLDDMAMEVAGGRASGRLTVRRQGPTAAVTGSVGLEGVGVERPALRGRLGASLEFAGTGDSANAILGGLVGQGEVKFSGATIPHLDQNALNRVMTKTETPDAPIDETNIAHALSLELDRQPLALPDIAATAILNSGVLRVGPVRLAEPTGSALATGDFDVRSLSLAIRTVFEEARSGKFWTGPPPSLTVFLRGGLDGLQRNVDASNLAAGLAAQAIARESDRIAALEADLRERAYFNRRMKAEQFLSRREAEIEAFKVEQERLKFEAERKRVEDALLKESEDREKAAAEQKRVEAESRKAEEDRRKAEAERRRLEDEARKAEEEGRRKAEAERRRLEDEARKAEQDLQKAPLPDPAGAAPSDPASPVVHATSPRDLGPKTDAVGADPAASGLY